MTTTYKPITNDGDTYEIKKIEKKNSLIVEKLY